MATDGTHATWSEYIEGEKIFVKESYETIPDYFVQDLTDIFGQEILDEGVFFPLGIVFEDLIDQSPDIDNQNHRYFLEVLIALEVSNTFVDQLTPVGLRLCKDSSNQYRIHILFEHLEGVNLKSCIGKICKDIESVNSFSSEYLNVVKMLHFLHSRGILHRDIKPSNILAQVDENFNVSRMKLLDFGLAYWKQVTLGNAIGSTAYQSNEILDFFIRKYNNRSNGLEMPASISSDTISAYITFWNVLIGQNIVTKNPIGIIGLEDFDITERIVSFRNIDRYLSDLNIGRNAISAFKWIHDTVTAEYTKDRFQNVWLPFAMINDIFSKLQPRQAVGGVKKGQIIYDIPSENPIFIASMTRPSLDQVNVSELELVVSEEA